MNGKGFFSRRITALILVIISLAILILLFIWTDNIRREDELKNLERELGRVLEERGEQGLLSSLGVEIDNIFYGKEGLILFAEGAESWRYSADEMQNISVFKRAAGSVVSISSSSSDGFSDFSSGSGVIISSDGYAITSAHVVSSGAEIHARLFDGTSCDALFIGSDRLTDVAVIKLDTDKKLVPIEMELDSSPVVGQKAIAIGCPYGYEWSQSVGTVSGLGRMVTSVSNPPMANMIQSDVTLNPGNSGGPLLDGHGRMIGMNTAIYSVSGGAEGISFALPSYIVLSAALEIIRTGSVSRGWLDILSVELNPMIAEYSGLPFSSGILVSQTVPSGEADKGGLRGGREMVKYGQSVIYLGGDVIVKINDRDIRDYNDYFASFLETKPGDEVTLTVYRNGSYQSLKGVSLVAQSEENMQWIIR